MSLLHTLGEQKETKRNNYDESSAVTYEQSETDQETATLTSATYLSTDNGEKVVRFIRKTETIKEENSSNEHEKLVCCPNATIHDVYYKVAGFNYHVNCLICSKCRDKPNNICYITSYKNDIPTIICEKCCEDMEEQSSICQVCSRPVLPDDDVVKLRKEFKLHKKCVHCFQCGQTQQDKVSFTAVPIPDNRYCCMCSDCSGIINGGTIRSDEKILCGRFNNTIFEKMKNNTCTTCRSEFPGRYFVAAKKGVFCRACGFYTIMKNSQQSTVKEPNS